MASPSILGQLRASRDLVTTAPSVERERLSPLVGSYARISDAYEGPDTGVTESGVKRQLHSNHLIAEARGWTVHQEYIDNDVSAFKTGVVREAFEDMLEDLRSGVIQGIVCYNLDRFCRQVTDLERAVAIYDEARRDKIEIVFATAEGDLNLASDDGLTMARVMVAFANKASRDTARRVTLKQREQRDQGEVRFGSRPFGLRRQEGDQGVSWVLEAREATAIRDAAEALTEGSMSISSITRSWNDAGLLTPKGSRWIGTTVRGVLRSPRIAGWLVHKGQIATHSQTGELVRANMPAILTDDEYEALLVALEDNARGSSTEHDGRKRYLLSGIARCGECGAKLAGHGLKRADKVYYYYTCRTSSRARDGIHFGCGKVGISGVGLDDMVERLVVPLLIENTGGLVVETDKPFAAELHDLLTEKDQLWTAYREQQAPSELVFPRAKQIEDEIERLRRVQAEWRREQRTRQRDEAITEESWPTLSLEERHRHVADYIEAIYVHRATKLRGNRFDPARVSEPVWRRRVDGDVPNEPAQV